MSLFAALGCTQSPSQADDLSIEFIAHASFRLTAEDGTRLVLDPYADRVWLGYDYPEDAVAGADAFVSSHPHYDHDSGEFIGREPIWGDSVRLKEPADARDVGPFSISGVVGRHAGPYGAEFDQQNTIWVVEYDGMRLVHWGDNRPIDDETANEIGRVDVLFLPVDGEEHILSFSEVEGTMSQLRPRVIIPMHYRHPALEVDLLSPEDLGPIEPFLALRDDVLRPGSYAATLSRSRLPDELTVLVLEPAPFVVAPEAL